MRAWLAVVAGAACACASGGIVLEVDTAGLDVASVELVLADRVCKLPDGGKCDSLRGKGFTNALGEPGDIYLRAANARSTALDGGLARFEIPSASHTIPMAFAIGRDASGRIVGTTVMAETIDLAAGPILYRATLEPTADVLGFARSNGMASAAQWGEGDRCVGIEPLTATLDPLRPVFIVPEDDLDCDRTAVECDPLWFQGLSVDEATARHCVVRSTVIAGGPCMLGHLPTCVENAADAARCAELPLRCVPDPVCTDCPAIDEPCQNAKLAEPALDGRLDCTFPAMEDGNGTLQPCATTQFALKPLDPLAPVRCIDSRTLLVQSPDTAIDSTLDSKFTSNGATFEIASVGEDCTILFKWSGNAAAVETSHTVMVVGVDVGGQLRELWAPINFSPSQVCPPDGTTLACTYVKAPLTQDHLFDCLR